MAYRVGIVPDDPRALLDAIEDQLVRADLVVTTGGVSVGAYDVVKEVLGRGSARSTFGKVAMQPGMPQGFGTIGPDETPIFTLPGNPVSAYVSFEVFVRPVIRRMLGAEPLHRPMVRRRLPARASGSPAGKRQLRPRRGSTVQRRAATSSRRSAARARTWSAGLAQANALIVVAGGRRARAGRGEPVDVLVLDGGPVTSRAGAAAHPRRRARRGAHGRRVRQGRHRPRGPGHRPGRWCPPTWSALLRGAGVPKGDALGGGPHRRHPGRQAHPRPGAAVPPDRDPRRATSTSRCTTTRVEIAATVRTADRTGVEMEALTCVAVAGAGPHRHGQGGRPGRRDHRRAGRGEARRQDRAAGPRDG